jgi:hypothetical protein
MYTSEVALLEMMTRILSDKMTLVFGTKASWMERKQDRLCSCPKTGVDASMGWQWFQLKRKTIILSKWENET